MPQQEEKEIQFSGNLSPSLVCISEVVVLPARFAPASQELRCLYFRCSERSLFSQQLRKEIPRNVTSDALEVHRHRCYSPPNHRFCLFPSRWNDFSKKSSREYRRHPKCDSSPVVPPYQAVSGETARGQTSAGIFRAVCLPAEAFAAAQGAVSQYTGCYKAVWV